MLLSGCEQQVNSSVSITENRNALTNDNETITKISHSETVTYLKESNSSKISASGNNSIVINNGQAYINGQNLDIDVSRKININYNDDKVIINDKTIDTKKELNKEIELKLTGNLVKVPFINTIHINSSIAIVQNCSENSETYLMLDSALMPYLTNQDKVYNGFIHLKNGNYKINGSLSLSLFSQPLKNLVNEGTANITVNCIDKNSLNLTSNGVGNITVSNINNKLIDVTQNGVGKVELYGVHTDELNAYNHGVGNITINFPISKARFSNSSVGNIIATEVSTLEAQNDGVGNININQVKTISKIIINSIGDIHIEKP